MSDQQDQAINTLFNALFTPPELFDDEPEVITEAIDTILLAKQTVKHAADTLDAIIKRGPLFDGDLPSKSQRDWLLEKGLVSKAVVKGEQGFQVANYLGWDVARVIDLRVDLASLDKETLVEWVNQQLDTPSYVYPTHSI